MFDILFNFYILLGFGKQGRHLFPCMLACYEIINQHIDRHYERHILIVKHILPKLF
jgi:hypothetical protein